MGGWGGGECVKYLLVLHSGMGLGEFGSLDSDQGKMEAKFSGAERKKEECGRADRARLTVAEGLCLSSELARPEK